MSDEWKGGHFPGGWHAGSQTAYAAPVDSGIYTALLQDIKETSNKNAQTFVVLTWIILDMGKFREAEVPDRNIVASPDGKDAQRIKISRIKMNQLSIAAGHAAGDRIKYAGLVNKRYKIEIEQYQYDNKTYSSVRNVMAYEFPKHDHGIIPEVRTIPEAVDQEDRPF